MSPRMEKVVDRFVAALAYFVVLGVGLPVLIFYVVCLWMALIEAMAEVLP